MQNLKDCMRYYFLPCEPYSEWDGNGEWMLCPNGMSCTAIRYVPTKCRFKVNAPIGHELILQSDSCTDSPLA